MIDLAIYGSTYPKIVLQEKNHQQCFKNGIFYDVFCHMGQKDQDGYYAKKCNFVQLLTWNTPIKKQAKYKKMLYTVLSIRS